LLDTVSSVYKQNLAEKNVSKMIYCMSSGT